MRGGWRIDRGRWLTEGWLIERKGGWKRGRVADEGRLILAPNIYTKTKMIEKQMYL